MSLFPYTIHQSWTNLLTPDFLQKILDVERELDQLSIHPEANVKFFPDYQNVMRFLTQDLSQIRYVILGMDPYPSWYIEDNAIHPIATGRSFEIGNLVSWQQKFKQNSLQNIIKAVYYNTTGKEKNLTEIRKDIADKQFIISPPAQWFDAIEAQGVLFLNATLTVAPDKPGSHTHLWRPAMQDIIRYINADHDSLCWLLFGDQAQTLIRKTLCNDHYLAHQCCHPRLAKFVTHNSLMVANDINWHV